MQYLELKPQVAHERTVLACSSPITQCSETQAMRVHTISIGDVTCAVHVNHSWSPADCVLVLGTGNKNKACFTIGQIPALRALIEQCAEWVAENDPLRPTCLHPAKEDRKTDEVA